MGSSKVRGLHIGSLAPRQEVGPELRRGSGLGSLVAMRCGPPVLGSEGSRASSPLASEQLKVIASSCKAPGMG